MKAGQKNQFILDQYHVEKIIDLSSCTVLPGLIDCHCKALHLPTPSMTQPMEISTSFKTLKALKYLQDMLYSGWTTVRLVGQDEFLHVDLKKAISGGLFEGPDIVVASHPICSTGGGTDSMVRHDKGHIGTADGIEEVVKTVRREVKFGSQWVYMEVNGTFLTSSNPKIIYYSSDEIEALVEQANHLKCPVMALAHSPSAIRMSVSAGVRSIEHGSFIDDEASAMLIDHDVYLVPMLQSTTNMETSDNDVCYMSQQMREKRDQCIYKSIQAGVKVCVGTGYYSKYGCNEHVLELAELVRLGMSNMEALSAATKVSSEMLGLDSEIGTIEAGKRADIIAVRGDLTTDITYLHNVVFVMTFGVVRKFNEKVTPQNDSPKGIYHIVSQQIDRNTDALPEKSHLNDSFSASITSSVFEVTNTGPSELFTKRLTNSDKQKRLMIYPWICPRCSEENFGWIDSCISCDTQRPGVRGSRPSDEYESILRSNKKSKKRRESYQEKVVLGTPNVLTRITERRNRRPDKPY